MQLKDIGRIQRGKLHDVRPLRDFGFDKSRFGLGVKPQHSMDIECLKCLFCLLTCRDDNDAVQPEPLQRFKFRNLLFGGGSQA